MCENLSSCGAFCCGLLALISIILFGVSFATIDPLTAGLRQDTISKSVDTDVYTSGRYFLGLTKTFLEFPATLQHVKFGRNGDYATLSGSTADGQQIQLEITFQYRIRLGQLPQLYAKHANNYRSKYITQVVEAIKNMAKSYTTQEFFSKREVIGEVFHVAANQALLDDYAVVEHLQLRGVTPPVATETSVLNKIIEQQNIIIAGVEQQSVLVTADSGLLIKKAEAQAIVLNAEAAKAAELLIGAARAKQTTVHLQYVADAWKGLKTEVGYTTDQLLKHMMLEHIRTMNTQNSLTVNFPSALFKQ
jgi:regulator of protease activity HflC (stomatin/prohibitin superfamily)